MAKLIAWAVPGWSLAMAGAWWLRGVDVLLPAVLALVICLPLALFSLRLALWSLDRGPNWQMGVILGGSAARMFLALAAAAGLVHLVPELGTAGLLPWVLAAYLLTLTLEVGILVGKIQAAQPTAVGLTPFTRNN